MQKKISFPLIGYVIFFTTLLLVSLLAILVFILAYRNFDNLTLSLIATFGIVFFLSFVFLIIDKIRRAATEEKYLKEIILTTSKIAEGDFSKKIEKNIPHSKKNPYFLIMENINVMISELRNNELMKNDFIANISHELKTPLAQIQSNAKMLSNDNLEDSEKEYCLENITSSIQRLSSLIGNILKLNKLENSNLNYTKEKFNFAELVRLNLIDYAEKIEEKNLRLDVDLEEIEYYGEKDLINIIVSNLISNAYKFTEKGFIKVSLKEEGDFLVFNVVDSGIGIPNENGKKIFEKFYQIDSSSKGNGLGLALSKKALEIVGGELNVSSKLNEGSSFSLKLTNAKNS